MKCTNIPTEQPGHPQRTLSREWWIVLWTADRRCIQKQPHILHCWRQISSHLYKREISGRRGNIFLTFHSCSFSSIFILSKHIMMFHSYQLRETNFIQSPTFVFIQVLIKQNCICCYINTQFYLSCTQWKAVQTTEWRYENKNKKEICLKCSCEPAKILLHRWPISISTGIILCTSCAFN